MGLAQNREFSFSRRSEGVEKKQTPFLNVVFNFNPIRIGLIRFGLALLHVIAIIEQFAVPTMWGPPSKSRRGSKSSSPREGYRNDDAPSGASSPELPHGGISDLIT